MKYPEEYINKVICGDCLDVMKWIPDDSIDMILCDLPYQMTSCSWDTIIPFEPLWETYKRIIKDNGAIVLTASQPFTSALVMSNLKLYRHQWIWNKGQAGNPFLAKLAPLKIFEDIIVFSKKRVNYYPQMTKGKLRLKNNLKIKSKITNTSPNKYRTKNSDYYPKAIICFNNSEEKKISYHPTQKPVALFEYLIRTYTNKGDLVLDNCAGSGTTGRACKNLGRNFILIEKEEKYCKIAEQRLKQEVLDF